jgi:hypothetical protein
VSATATFLRFLPGALKPIPAASEKPNMSKRGLLWGLGLVAFGFTYISAVNVKDFHSGAFGSGYTCNGLWDFSCGYFAERDSPGTSAGSLPPTDAATAPSREAARILHGLEDTQAWRERIQVVQPLLQRYQKNGQPKRDQGHRASQEA